MAGLNSGSAGRCEAQPFSARFRHHAPRPQEGASTTIRQLHFTEGAILLYRAPLGRPQATPRASMVKSAQAAAQERLARLLSASPAVIYSFKASGDFAPTFISDNIIDVFGYAPAEYLRDPSFWGDRVHPDDLARVEEAVSKSNGLPSLLRIRR